MSSIRVRPTAARPCVPAPAIDRLLLVPARRAKLFKFAESRSPPTQVQLSCEGCRWTRSGVQSARAAAKGKFEEIRRSYLSEVSGAANPQPSLLSTRRRAALNGRHPPGANWEQMNHEQAQLRSAKSTTSGCRRATRTFPPRDIAGRFEPHIVAKSNSAATWHVTDCNIHAGSAMRRSRAHPERARGLCRTCAIAVRRTSLSCALPNR